MNFWGKDKEINRNEQAYSQYFFKYLRKFKDNNGKMELSGADYHKYKPYYMIITDDYKLIRDTDIIKDVSEMPINYGFSLVVISPRLINIPNECKTFISIGDKKSGVFENELVSNKQKEFEADFDPTLNMYECCKIIANIPTIRCNS